MSFDSTMQFRTNMSRGEIDAMLADCRTFAAAADLQEVAKLLTGTEGLPPAELNIRLNNCLANLGAKDEYGLLIDKLDMLMINLANLK